MPPDPQANAAVGDHQRPVAASPIVRLEVLLSGRGSRASVRSGRGNVSPRRACQRRSVADEIEPSDFAGLCRAPQNAGIGIDRMGSPAPWSSAGRYPGTIVGRLARTARCDLRRSGGKCLGVPLGFLSSDVQRLVGLVERRGVIAKNGKPTPARGGGEVTWVWALAALHCGRTRECCQKRNSPKNHGEASASCNWTIFAFELPN